MVTPAHVAEQVMGLFERNYAPLLGHLTDIVEELQERVDCLEDAAPPDEGLAGGGLAHLVKEEVARLVARVRCLSVCCLASGSGPSAELQLLAAQMPRPAVYVSAPPSPAELGAVAPVAPKVAAEPEAVAGLL